MTGYTYDALGRLAAKTTTKEANGAALASYAYTYNAAGFKQNQTSTIAGDPANGVSSYAYDELGRLTGYTAPVGAVSSQQYEWNATPDRASIKIGTANKVTTYYDAASRPLSDNPSSGSYSSDGQGRLTAQPGQTLTYDALGRLARVVDTTSGTTDYLYDPLDRLVTKTNAGVTTKYLYVGLTTTVAATIVGSTITNRATDASGGLLCEWSPDSVSVPIYIGTNGHGDVTWTATPTTIAAGTTIATAAYDPFGKVVSHTGNLPAERWQGSLYDESSGLYYVIARWYGPTIGRFLSVDPVAGNATRPGTLNPYAYGAGDPINSIDPSGQIACGLARDDCAEVGHQKVTPRPVVVAVPQRSCGSGPGGCATLIETVRSMGGPGGEAVCSHSEYDFCSTDNVTLRSDVKHDQNVARDDAALKVAALKAIADQAAADREALYEAFTAPQAAASPAPGCSLNPFDGNSCASQAIGGIGDAWSATGGAVIDYGLNHPGEVLGVIALASALGGCILVTAGACAAAALVGAGAGFGGYTASVVVPNCFGRGCSLDGWDGGQAAVATGGGAMTAMSCAASAGVGCVVTGATTAGMQYASSPGEKTPAGYALNMVTGGVLSNRGGATLANTLRATLAGALKGAGVGNAAGWFVQQLQGVLGW